MTPEEVAALDVARALAAAGIPIFVAYPDPSEPTGFKLPTGWQRTPADPRTVDAWRPGMALAMVCGHGLDLLDVDPRSGGDPAALNGATPVSYGAAFTPSGGVHSFIRSLGVHSKNNVVPGIDVKAGAADGSGRGFAFIAPTVRVSKVDGQPYPYRWAVVPDLARLSAAADDTSGAALAKLIEAGRAGGDRPSVESFMRSGPWAGLESGAVWTEGRNTGVARLAQALRGRGGWRLDDALEYMRERVYPLIDQSAGGHAFTLDEFEATIKAQWRQYPDGQAQRAELVATPPDPAAPFIQPNPGRYFADKGGLKAATLAGDVVTLGPLAQGADHVMWRYDGGVWRSAKTIVRDRCAHLLGELFRTGHAGTAEAVVASRVHTITCEPIEPLINFRNGLLEWRTGQLYAHSPDVLSTVQLPVVYDPEALCPAFRRFLGEVVPEDVVPTVWELIGYLMYSGNPLHKAVMLTGHGRNGKGTLLRVVNALLGRANVTSVSLHDLVNTRFTTASLFGKLANIAGDIDAGYLENTAIFKAITGGDQISAEHKGRDRFDFTPWAVPVFSANKIPASADTTIGYLSRWLVINFPYDFSGREDRGLTDRITTPAELAGIAAAGIAALPGLLARRDFAETTSGHAAKEEFAQRVDQVRTWLIDCTEPAPEHWHARTDMYAAYRRWAERDGYRPVKAHEFYDRLEAVGLNPAKIHGIRGYRGARIADEGWVTLGNGAPAPTAPTVTRVDVPQGAEGAGETPQDSTDKTDVDQGAGNSDDLEPKTAPSEITNLRLGCQPVDNPVDNLSGGRSEGAGTDSKIEPSFTSANGSDDLSLDLEGAVTPYPTRARVRVYTRGGYQDPAPVPPITNESKPTKLDKATKAAAEREVKITVAAGDLVDLPAAVDRKGTVVPLTLERAAMVAQIACARNGALTVDVETTGYPVGHHNYALQTIQLGGPDIAVVLDAADPQQLMLAQQAIGQAPKLHAHSATADLVPLAHARICDESAWDRMHDTVIPAKLADPESTGSDPGLKQLAPAVLGDQATTPAADQARAELFKAGKWLTDTDATTPIERSGWAQVDKRCTTMIRYGASDVLDTAALAVRLPTIPPAVLDRERAVQRITARVTHRGLRIDGDQVAKLGAEHSAARAEAGELVRAHGIDNPGSDTQIAARLTTLGAPLPMTKPSTRHPNGQPSVAAAALSPLSGVDGQVGELVRAVLDFRHHDTVLGTFLGPYRELVERGDGRARPTIYTLGTDTGRMSCVRPNFQQLPRQGGVRACATADHGYMLISADFSSVEVRGMAALSQDPNLIKILAEGADLHAIVAAQAFGPGWTKSDRYTAKRGVFNWAYGGGIGNGAKQLGVSEGVMAAIIDSLALVAPRYVEWASELKRAVRSGATQMPTYAGRIIHLPRAYPHKAPNYAIQGTARELLVDSLIAWDQTRWAGSVVLPVHDEILAMVPADEAQEATAALVQCMTTSLYGVPIVAEADEPSFAWQDAV